MKLIKIFNKFPVYFFSIGLILLTPLIYSKITIEPLLSIRLLYLGFMTVLINLIYIPYIKRIKIYFLSSPMFLSLAGFILFTFISYLFAYNKVEALCILCKYLSYFLFFLSTYYALKITSNPLKVVFRIIILTVLIITSVGLIQYFFHKLYSIPGAKTLYSLFANRNLFSSIVVILVPFSLYVWLTDKRLIWRILSFISLIFSAAIVGIIKARTSWLAIFMATTFVIVLLLILRYFSKKNLKKSLTIIGVIIIVFIAGYVSTKFIKDYQGNKQPWFGKVLHEDTDIERKQIIDSKSFNIRWQAWKRTFPMIGEYFFTGVGPGNWKIFYPKYGLLGTRAERGFQQYVRPHNDYLWIFSENGVLSFICYILMFFFSLYYATQAIRKKKNITLNICLLWGIINFMIISFFSFPIERVYHSMIFMLYLVILMYINEKQDNRDRTRSKEIRKTLVTLLLTIALSIPLAYYHYVRFKNEIFLSHAFAASKAKQPILMLSVLDRIDPHIMNITPTGYPISWYSGIELYRQRKIDLALKYLKQAEKENPYHIYVLNNLGSIYVMEGDLDQAFKYYNKVLDISPRFEETLINLAAVYYNMEQYDKAYEYISKCKPDTENPKVIEYRNLINAQLERKKE